MSNIVVREDGQTHKIVFPQTWTIISGYLIPKIPRKRSKSNITIRKKIKYQNYVRSFLLSKLVFGIPYSLLCTICCRFLSLVSLKEQQLQLNYLANVYLTRSAAHKPLCLWALLRVMVYRDSQHKSLFGPTDPFCGFLCPQWVPSTNKMSFEDLVI